jgi:hypothetical protein
MLACFSILCLSITVAGPAQKAGTKDKINQDSVPQSYFIRDDFFVKYDMDQKASNNPFMHVWISPVKNSKFSTINDIRLSFANKHKALAFFKKNLAANSENATEIHPGITIQGTQELHIYKESDAMAIQNKKDGYNLRYYFFLFLVDKVYVKVFVSANIETTVQDASIFAIEAAKTVQLATKK